MTLSDSATLVGLTIALTQAVKRIYRAMTDRELGDMSIVVAILVGIGLSVARAVQAGTFIWPSGIVDAVMAGITIGLVACGLYSLAKTAIWSWAAGRW